MKNLISRAVLCIIIIAVIAPVPGFTQLRKITGIVTAFDQYPLKHVTVTAKKAKTEAVTDENGHFELTVKTKDLIQITNPVFVDYSQKIKETDDYLKINMIIKNDDESMTKAVDNGFIAQNEMEYGRSHLARQNSEFGQFKDVYDAIKYALPECTVISENGQKGIQFRGPKTMHGSNRALIVVDGVVVDDANFVSPGSIMKITKLSANMAAARYGERAANGVVSVNTK